MALVVSQPVQVVIIQFTWRAENAKTKARLMLCASQSTRLGNQSKCPTINQLACSHNRRVRSDKCKIKWDKQKIEANSPLLHLFRAAVCPCPSRVATAPLWRVYCFCFFRGQLQLWLVNYWKEPTTTQRSQMTHAPVPWLEWLAAWKLMSLACWPLPLLPCAVFSKNTSHTHAYTRTHTQSGDY